METAHLFSGLLDFSDLETELLKLIVVLKRPALQIQLLVILSVCLLSFLITKYLLHQITQRFPAIRKLKFNDTKMSLQEYSFTVIHFLLSPLLIFCFLSLFILLFKYQGWFSGYLKDWTKIALDLIVFRIFIFSLYAIFPTSSVRYYYYRFFAPLFYLFIIFRLMGSLINLRNLFQVSVITLFGQTLMIESIFVAVAGFYFWLVGLSLLEKLFIKVLEGLRGGEILISHALSLILRYFLITLGIVIITGYIGISPTAIAAITGGLSVGIGFGLKEVISNFVSGIWLLFEGSLKPGDYVKINGNIARVKQLGVRATTFEIMKDNSQEIIPNQRFFTDNITPVTGSDNLTRRSLIVGASYDCHPQDVLNAILQVAHQHPKVLKLPTPVAFVINFGESSIDYELRFWLNDPNIGLTVTSDLMCEIWEKFAEENITIPFPQRDIHIIKYSKFK